MATNRDKINNTSNMHLAFILGKCSTCGLCPIASECNIADTCEINWYKWLEKEIEPTADEMFQKLGYTMSDKGNMNYIEYTPSNKIGNIYIYTNDTRSNDGYSFRKTGDPMTRLEAEATMKKIRELKGKLT